MTFSKICWTSHDTGRVYVLYYIEDEEQSFFQAYDPFYNSWNYDLDVPNDIPKKGSALCPWVSGVENAKIFAIPYDYSGGVGHIFEYDIDDGDWNSLDTIPHTENYLGYGLSLKTGNYCEIKTRPYINLYYFGGRDDEFYVYRREVGPPSLVSLNPGWTQLADYPHNHKDGADIAYRPDSNVANPRRVYGLRGGGYDENNFYYYNIDTDYWTWRPNAFAVDDGGALAADGVLGSDTLPSVDKYIYAFRGDNNNDFSAYDHVNSTWTATPLNPAYDADQGADLAFGYYNTEVLY